MKSLYTGLICLLLVSACKSDKSKTQLTEKNNVGAMGNITTNQGTKYQMLTKSGANIL